MTTTKTTIAPNGTYVSLRAVGLTEKVDRASLTEDPNEFFMGLMGRGATLTAALSDLQKRVSREVRRLEGSANRKPPQERRLSLLKGFLS
jgi:hypothetical protein